MLTDPKTIKLVKDRRELGNLQFVSVSLLVGRGLTLNLHFSEQVNSADFSQSSFNASGGVSFFGFSFGGGGGRSQTSSTIKVDASGTTVTFQDGDNVARVLGARVEPFVTAPSQPQNLNALVGRDQALGHALKEFESGKLNYKDFQKDKLQSLQRLQAQ